MVLRLLGSDTICKCYIISNKKAEQERLLGRAINTPRAGNASRWHAGK